MFRVIWRSCYCFPTMFACHLCSLWLELMSFVTSKQQLVFIGLLSLYTQIAVHFFFLLLLASHELIFQSFINSTSYGR